MLSVLTGGFKRGKDPTLGLLPFNLSLSEAVALISLFRRAAPFVLPLLDEEEVGSTAFPISGLSEWDLLLDNKFSRRGKAQVTRARSAQAVKAAQKAAGIVPWKRKKKWGGIKKVGKVLKKAAVIPKSLAAVAAPLAGAAIGGPAGYAAGRAVGEALASPTPSPSAPSPVSLPPEPAVLTSLESGETGATVLSPTDPQAEQAFEELSEEGGAFNEEEGYPYEEFESSEEFDELADACAFALGHPSNLSPVQRDGTDYACSCGGLRLRDFSGPLPSGTFFNSRLVRGRIETLPDGVFGQVDLSDTPFSLSISNSAGPARARIALAHELAHVANKLYKLGLSHSAVHDLGVFYSTEGLPALQSLSNQARS
jgi:hypothetical protein